MTNLNVWINLISQLSMCLIIGTLDQNMYKFVLKSNIRSYIMRTNKCSGVIDMHVKYVGRTVEIIYQDRKGKLTQRRIVVRTIQSDRISAYDITSGSYRVFKVTGILAVQPVMSA